MKLTSIFTGWQFDIKSAIMTVIVVPVVFFVIAVVKRYVKLLGGYALEGVMYLIAKSLRHSIAAALTLKRYCRQRLSEENRYLFVPSSLDIKLDIDKMFVPLTLEGQGMDEAVYSHANVLQIGNRIRVIGDPGSGKSSLIKRLFRDACVAGMANPRKARLPILFELRHLIVPKKISPQKLGDWFIEKLRSDLAVREVYQMVDCFDAYKTTSGLLLLLDGLDEVSSENYPRVEQALNALSSRLGAFSENNIIVLTMRTQFHQQIKDGYRDSFGYALSLKPFTPTDIYVFLSRWPFPSKANECIARIYKELTDRPTLRDMCSNPLILSMYVAEDQTSDHIVAPESRTEFYGKICEELIIKRRLQQTGPATAYTKLREQRERILGRLAFDHMLDSSQPANSLRWSEAIAVVSDVMRCDPEKAAIIFRDLAKETGLITEERFEQSFRFIHLTFCEFLAAYEAVQGQEIGWITLIDKHRSVQVEGAPQLVSRLIEVIPFACGLLPRVKRETAISDVAKLKDSGLMARAFLETKLYDHPSWASFVKSEQLSLISAPEDAWDSIWLKRLHLFNVVVRDAMECANHIPQDSANIEIDAFFRLLVRQQKESLAKLLGAYAAQDAAAAFRLAELSNCDLAMDFPEIIIEHCDQSPFFALVLEQALRDRPSRAPRWASLLATAGLESIVVSRWLSTTASAEQWRDLSNSVPMGKRWMLRGLFSENFYTQCLSISGTCTDDVANPILAEFLRIPAPGGLRGIMAILPLFAALLVAGSGATLMLFRYGLMQFVLSLFLAGCGIVTMIVYMEVHAIYFRIMYPSRMDEVSPHSDLYMTILARSYTETSYDAENINSSGIFHWLGVLIEVAFARKLVPRFYSKLALIGFSGLRVSRLLGIGRFKDLRVAAERLFELRSLHRRVKIWGRVNRGVPGLRGVSVKKRNRKR